MKKVYTKPDIKYQMVFLEDIILISNAKGIDLDIGTDVDEVW